MISRSLAFGLLTAGAVTAAAGGSFLAVRQNAAAEGAAVAQATPSTPAVQETEAVVSQPEPSVERAPNAAIAPVAARRVVEPRSAPVRPRRSSQVTAPRPKVPRDTEPLTVPEMASAAATGGPDLPAVATTDSVSPSTPPVPASEKPARASEPVYEEIVLPVASVIGLELETSLTSERARVEDRVDARVTRDVYAGGRLAIPAGSRVIGSVTLVERGGKVKERARLGVRFHTLVLAAGRQVDLRTEPIYREGESPAGDSSKKIGGAAIGGAVVGAILGGGKGAIAGGAAGAAGGTAVVMAGDRKPATLPVGSVVTVKLAAPVALEVER
jgi:type IV secretory pathway VirB10-like protein